MKTTERALVVQPWRICCPKIHERMKWIVPQHLSNTNTTGIRINFLSDLRNTATSPGLRVFFDIPLLDCKKKKKAKWFVELMSLSKLYLNCNMSFDQNVENNDNNVCHDFPQLSSDQYQSSFQTVYVNVSWCSDEAPSGWGIVGIPQVASGQQW